MTLSDAVTPGKQEFTVAVAGASGYAGAELVRIIQAHPRLRHGALAAGSHAGELIQAVHPQLASLGDQRFTATDPELLNEADLLFTALPHGTSAALIAQLRPDLLVVDLGADYRLQEAGAWEQYYGGDHAGTWVYGMPELPGQREKIAQSHRVANPGCYPTGVILGLQPLAQAGLIHTEDIVVTAASGVTGAGRSVNEMLLGSRVIGSMRGYKVGGVHQHTPEMEQGISAVVQAEDTATTARVSFTPLLAPMTRGILASSSARVASGVTQQQLREALSQRYADETFVTVLPEGSQPETSAVFGTNAVHLQVVLDTHTNRAVITSVIDNLGKGAAGQAVQNANLMLGLAESAGLSTIGVTP